MAKPKLLKLEQPQLPEDMRAAVNKMLAENYPFACVAQRPDATWEKNVWKPRKMSDYELVGALWSLQHDLLYSVDEDEESGAS
jgi:hypothetical protein